MRLIVGMAKRDGSADLALAVSTALARAGRKVVVVDANDESDELSALIGAEGPGLFELLSHPEMDPMDVALTRPRWPAVIGSGAIGSSTLVDPDAARKLIEKLNEHFDIVVIASAPIHLSGHALVWAKAAGLVVLAVERDRAKRDDVVYAVENLAGVETTVLGAVLLDHAPRPDREARPSPTPRRAAEPYAVAATRTPTARRVPSRQRDAPDAPARPLSPMGLRSRLFWASAAVVGYTYVGFPLVVLVRGRLRPTPYRSADITPTVNLLVAATTRPAGSPASSRMPSPSTTPQIRLDIVVASDGSNDHTEAIVATFVGRGIRLLQLPRQGKALALNAAVAASTGEILVFSDANSLYAADAVRRLVRPFADPLVGGVAGNQRYRPGSASDATTAGEQVYWDFDRLLKEAESRAGSTISATGAIYAIRRSLFRGVPVGVTDDFAVSTSVIEQGYRLVFAADALAWEPVASSGSMEWDRRFAS